MMDPKLLAAALFLPLFPLSMLFSILFEGLRHVVLRAVVLLAWPQIGVWLFQGATEPVPSWMTMLALFTSLLYGFRALVLRELVHWISFLAVSSWTLLWVASGSIANDQSMSLLALGCSAPLVILTVLGLHLQKRFGASYSGLYNGLGHTMPRFSGVLVFTILAVVATPVFPGFVVMMAAFLEATHITLIGTILLCLVWMIWAWAGARLIQGFVIGESKGNEVDDLPVATVWVYVVLLAGLGVFGLTMMDVLS